MRRLSSLLILLAAGGSALLTASCASGPAGPTLPDPLMLKVADYEEAGGILPINGTLELLIEPTGVAQSACRRQIFTDVERKGDLSREQLAELLTRVEAWTSKAGDLPPGTPKSYGILVYGTKKAAWEKDASLPPELQALVTFLKTLPPTLRVIQHRR